MFSYILAVLLSLLLHIFKSAYLSCVLFIRSLTDDKGWRERKPALAARYSQYLLHSVGSANSAKTKPRSKCACVRVFAHVDVGFCASKGFSAIHSYLVYVVLVLKLACFLFESLN